MILSNIILSVERPGESTIVGGRSTAGTSTTFECEASIQPATPMQMAALPEGRDALKTYILFTETELRGVDPDGQRNPDKVTFQGEVYEVYKVDPWIDELLGHYESIIQLVHV